MAAAVQPGTVWGLWGLLWDIGLFVVPGLVGYTRGRKTRLRRYTSYLLGLSPEDAQQSLVSLAEAETAPARPRKTKSPAGRLTRLQRPGAAGERDDRHRVPAGAAARAAGGSPGSRRRRAGASSTESCTSNGVASSDAVGGRARGGRADNPAAGRSAADRGRAARVSGGSALSGRPPAAPSPASGTTASRPASRPGCPAARSSACRDNCPNISGLPGRIAISQKSIASPSSLKHAAHQIVLADRDAAGRHQQIDARARRRRCGAARRRRRARCRPAPARRRRR